VALTNPKTMKERVHEHVADPRFRGVYLLLALRAPLDVAKEIRDQLADNAAEARDHVLSNEVWGIVRQRLEAAPRPKKAEQLAEAPVITGQVS